MTDETLNPLFDKMVAEDASDLHWCEGERPRLRVHGYLKEMGVPTQLMNVSFGEITARLIGHGNFEKFSTAREFDGSDTVCGDRRIRINV